MSVFWQIDEGRKWIDFEATVHLRLVHPELRAADDWHLFRDRSAKPG